MNVDTVMCVTTTISRPGRRVPLGANPNATRHGTHKTTDALAWPAPGPIAIPGATEPSTAAGNSSSSSSSNNGGMGRGIGGMRRELSYPDIAGMSLSSSPSTNSVLAAAAASSVSPSLRPRRRSGSGGGAAAMLSTQQQQPHQQILPSPYGASPGGSFGASPSLPSPLQALGGRAPTTQEERRQLRCVAAVSQSLVPPSCFPPSSAN